jgi:hypothetical protein
MRVGLRRRIGNDPLGIERDKDDMKTVPHSVLMQALKEQGRTSAAPIDLWGLVRKSAYLNLGVLLSAAVMAGLQRGPDAVAAVGALVVIISAILWAVTLVVVLSVWLLRLFWRLDAVIRRQQRRRGVDQGDLRDRWLDELV